jgi:hypothetical protein
LQLSISIPFINGGGIMSKLIKNPIVKIIATSMLFVLMICAYGIILFEGTITREPEPVEYTINMSIAP